MNSHVRVNQQTNSYTGVQERGFSRCLPAVPAARPQGSERGTTPRAQRADARRNSAAILAAATDCLARATEMSTADIATAAGPGRIALYDHFRARADARGLHPARRKPPTIYAPYQARDLATDICEADR